MSKLSYQTIKQLCITHRLIEPWCERTVENGMTFGLGPAGYDIRCAEKIILSPDPYKCTALVSSIEHFNMPDFLQAEVKDKSSWARRFLFVQNTLIDPGWSGYLTLELSAHQNVVVLPGDPIAQIVFDKLDEKTKMPYKGRYQAQQKGPQQPRKATVEIDQWAHNSEQCNHEWIRNVNGKGPHISLLCVKCQIVTSTIYERTQVYSGF